MNCILLAQPLTADEAKTAGLVASVVSHDALVQHCVEIASKFTADNKQTIAFAKQAVCRGASISRCDNTKLTTRTADDLGRDDRFERDLYYTAFGTAEKRRGVDDFLARRKKA